MTKKEMAEEILQNSTLMGVSENRFYNNIKRFTKVQIQSMYDTVMKSVNKTSDATYYSWYILDRRGV